MDTPTIASIWQHLRARVSAALSSLGIDEGPALAPPPDPTMGDVGFPCFALSKVLRRAPQQIAEQIAQALEPDAVVAQATAVKGYVNVRFHDRALAAAVVGDVLTRGDRFGGDSVGRPLRYVVEYSAPNTNKPLHLGHVRNNVLGLSVTRTLAHVGHDVVAVNLINDRGVHICKSMLAYQRWGEGTDPQRAGMKGDFLVGHFYVLFDQRFTEEYRGWLASEAGAEYRERWRASPAGRRARDPEAEFPAAFRDDYFNTVSPLGTAAREMLRRWEEGDPDVRALWTRMNGWVYEGFDQTYARMQVHFDRVYHESETYTLGKALVEDGVRRGLFRRLDDGAVVCDYERLGLEAEQSPYKVLLRGDGTSVYTTQDLGTAMLRFEDYRFERMVYVVGDEQRHHFQVLFALLAALEPRLSGACHHLAYGMVNLPEGKMKSREGRVVDADALMDEMRDLAAEELRRRFEEGRAHTQDLDEAEVARRAEAIGQAAIKFHLLSFAAGSTVRFDPKKSIDFLGRTGPYCLNAYARTRSLLRRAGAETTLDFDVDAVARLTSERERAILMTLMAFPDRIGQAADGLDPAKVVDAAYDVARAFNQLYTDKEGHPIERCDDPVLRQGRLLLAAAVGRCLRIGLHLLGIGVLEEM